MEQQAVLCIGAGSMQVPLLREAQALGLLVIAIDGNPEAPGATVADLFYPIDTYNVDGVIDLARSLPGLMRNHGRRFAGVVTAGADVAVTVAHAARSAQVPGIPVEVAQRSHNKALVRRALSEAGLDVYQPKYLVSSVRPVDQFCVDVHQSLGYPCVVKPLSQRASRGVTLLQDDTLDPIMLALNKASAYGDRILVEQRLQGLEHSVEAILCNGALQWFNIVDRFFTYTDGIPLEIGHINPTKLPKLAQQQLQIMLLLIAHALDVSWGPFKMDVIWTDDGPKLLEATARLSGGWDSMGTSPLTGRYPLRILLQVVCDLPIEQADPPDGYAACAAILPKESGTIVSLPTRGDLPVEPSIDTFVHEIIWNVLLGDILQPFEHCAHRPGFVLTWANGAVHAWAGAQCAAEELAAQIRIRP